MYVGYKTVPYSSKNDHINRLGRKKIHIFSFIYSQSKLTKTGAACGAALCLEE